MSGRPNLSLLSRLRKETFCPLSQGRAALISANNNYAKALEFLAAQSPSKKLANRTCREGLVSLIKSHRSAMLVEVNAETDFVSRSSDFVSLVDRISATAFLLRDEVGDDTVKMMDIPVTSFTSEDVTGTAPTVSSIISTTMKKTGENIVFRRVGLLSARNSLPVFMGTYVHSSTRLESMHKVGRIGAIISLSLKSTPTLSKLGEIDSILCDEADRIAQHVVAMAPASVEELKSQAYFFDQKSSVAGVLDKMEEKFSVGIEIDGIIRFEVGEGIEKVESLSFADEVASMVS